MSVFATAMTSGVLLALAVHMLSGQFGVGLTNVWREPFPSDADAVRSAFAWWMIAGAGFAGSFAAGLAVQDVAPGRRPRPGLRRLAGVLFFLLLAAVPFVANVAAAPNLPLALAANLAAVALATLSAFCGSWFSLPR